MKEITIRNEKMSIKEAATLAVALLCVIASLVVIFISLWIPPEGEIHNSVLTYFGITLAFCGSLTGISAHYSAELTKIKKSAFPGES